jgi:ABC-type sugar transport system substrate-binding protein
VVVTALVALAVVAGLAAFFSTRAAAHREYTVAYVGGAADYVQSMARGSRAAAKRLGVHYVLAGQNAPDDHALSKVYRSLIARHVDAIFSQGYDRGLTQTFAKIRKAGILLIASGDDIAAERDLWVTQSDPAAYGRALADALASQIHNKGEYAILEQDGQFPIATRWAHLVKHYITSTYPKMKLAGVIEGTGAGDQTEVDVVKGFISAHPHLKGLIGITPTEASVAARAIIQAGKVGQVFSAGNGDDRLGDTQSPQYVRSGATELVYVGSPVTLGYLTVWAAKYLLAGHRFKERPTRPQDHAGRPYHVGGPIGTVWYLGHGLLPAGQPFTVTKANVDRYANQF